jgi:hypothetical protein
MLLLGFVCIGSILLRFRALRAFAVDGLVKSPPPPFMGNGIRDPISRISFFSGARMRWSYCDWQHSLKLAVSAPLCDHLIISFSFSFSFCFWRR